MPFPWEQPLGATPAGDGLVTFRCWAPNAERVSLRLDGAEHPMEDEGFGVRSLTTAARHGDRYWFVLDGAQLPDPASRHQPEGLRGPSAVVDPGTWPWTDSGFTAPTAEELVIYELHIGTFSDEGTFDGAIPHLADLADLGVTAVEVMPVAEFPGVRGWGYDGVHLSATQHSYGGPDAFARFVDAAHAAGLAVLLDCVYNHVGASGQRALEAYGPYFTSKYSTFWGDAINFDDAHCDPVREWVLQSAEGWVRDLHVDGLRLDALHAIFDGSATHICQEIATRVHAANPRAYVIAESGMNDPKVTRPGELGGWGHDAQWADDFHHALRTLLTGDRESYYEEFGEVHHLVKCFHRPFLHDGTYSTFRERRFGASATDRPPTEFVVFSQNHDQVGNRPMGDRLAPELLRLAAFATLLSPFVPMLWMGEEHGEPAPFQFFTDHIDEEIATATREGRRREFASFAAFSGEEVPDPQDPRTFERSKLTRDGDPELRDLYRRLLRARRELPAGDARADGHDDLRWVRVTRGAYELLMNFASEPRTVPTTKEEVVLTTHQDQPTPGDGGLALPAMSGALVR